jgi:hypothetical protein
VGVHGAKPKQAIKQTKQTSKQATEAKHSFSIFLVFFSFFFLKVFFCFVFFFFQGGTVAALLAPGDNATVARQANSHTYNTRRV